MMRASASWKEKLPGMLVALAVQTAILAALIYSLVVPPAPPQKEQEVIFVLPRLPAPRQPIIIDARPKPPVEAPPAVATTNLPTVRSGITAGSQIAPPPSTLELMQSLGPAQECRPDERGRPLCPAPAKPAGPSTAFDPNPPSTVKDEARWAEEKRRRGISPEMVEVAPGVSVGPVGPGVGFVITDPLCRMAKLLLAGGFTCGYAAPASNQYTAAQFKAALEATNKRRGVKTPAAVASPPSGENGNEKDGSNRGTGADSDGPRSGR